MKYVKNILFLFFLPFCLVACSKAKLTSNADDTQIDQHRVSIELMCPVINNDEHSCLKRSIEIINAQNYEAILLDDFQLEEAKIHGVAAFLFEKENDFLNLRLQLGIVGTAQKEGAKRAFLLVLENENPEVYTINWFDDFDAESVFLVDYPRYIASADSGIESDWMVLVCGDICKLVSSRSTPEKEDSLKLAEGIEELEIEGPIAVGRPMPSINHLIVLGNGVARLTSEGTWKYLISPDEGKAYHASYWHDPEIIILAGENGLISVIFEEEVVHFQTDISDTFTHVIAWLHWYQEDVELSPLVLFAVTDSGEAVMKSIDYNLYYEDNDVKHTMLYCDFVESLAVIEPLFRQMFNPREHWLVKKDGSLYKTDLNRIENIEEWKWKQFVTPECNSFSDQINGIFTVVCQDSGNAILWNDNKIFIPDYRNSSYIECIHYFR